tara:strand:+ start:433 stop:624 length:192 start_codon:yes stop_codon:yes gene_type:complete
MPKLTIQQINALYLKWSLLPVKTRVPFNDFKKTAYPMIGGDGAVVVHWAGMHLAIETNGHVHS